MPFGSSQWMYASGGFYNGVATQSLRFDDGSSAYLSRTPSSASNRKTFVFSAWIKRGALGGNKSFFGSYFANDNNSQFYISFNSSDKLVVSLFSTYTIASDAVFRDISSWYHVVVACDVTQSTDSNRWEVYVNGQEITFTGTYPPNADTAINSTNAHYVGHNNVGGFHFDGYMAEVNFIDGLSFFSDTSGTPNTSFNINSFGETKNGVWIPIEYTGSYGTNGFRLQFNQTGTGTASSSTIGADTSGNANHFTSSGIVASDCDMPDSPENNFCTLNPLDDDSHTNAEGNLKVSGNVIYGHEKSTFAVTSGKWYFEGKLAVQQNDTGIGLANQNASSLGAYLGQTSDSLEYASDGRFFYNGGTLATYTSYTTTDIVQIAFNADTGEIWIGKNNTWQNSGDPANGTGEVVTVSWSEFIASARTVGSGEMVFNFGQDDTFAGAISATGNTDGNGVGVFKYAPPSGFLALCTANLPEPTISPNADTQADDYFNTVLWTGDATFPRNISGVGFDLSTDGGLVWIRNRSIALSHTLWDSVRGAGANKELSSNNTTAEGALGALGTTADYGYISSLTSDGFDVAEGATGFESYVNASGNAYVAWNWKAGGTAVSNTDGSITSSVSANTDAGFSVVSYTGNGTAGATVGHSLAAVPSVIIVKPRSIADNWNVYHSSNTANPETDVLYLNLTNATSDNNTMWNDTAPTSSVFTIGSNSGINTNSSPYIAYCFAGIDGYSKFGSYIGNGNADGTFVYTGFRPAWVMMKNTVTSGNSWIIQDAVRSTYNEVNAYLLANDNGAEGTGVPLDMLSNGFKMTSASQNDSGANFIYMAFAENPFKYANAR